MISELGSNNESANATKQTHDAQDDQNTNHDTVDSDTTVGTTQKNQSIEGQQTPIPGDIVLDQARKSEMSLAQVEN